jgi:hypothetical protein
MQHHVVALGEHSLKVHSLARILPRHAREVLDERVLAVRDRWIVLDVHLSDEAADCFGGLALIEHQIVERGDRPLILFFASHAGLLLLCPSVLSVRPLND